MGNEQSQIPGIQIEEKAVEVSDFWSQHIACICEETISNLTVLIGDLFVQGPLWITQTPLEKYSKNLMIYRHPCIVKYISSWQNGSKFYLAVEETDPLSHVLPKLSTLQICIGLYSILKALCFLHEKAFVSHNNVCIASVYVTKDGSSWKLGGMEYLCRYKDFTCDYLNKSRSNRYSKAVDCNEDKHIQHCGDKKDFVDLFAFGVLVCEVLKSKDDAEVPLLSTFKGLCKTILQSPDISERPTLKTLLDHEFFKHDFIKIHSFLVELPLKTDVEKKEFFSTLKDKLQVFNEEAVAGQLGGLLLSRMVLLNKTAQTDLLPHILCPQKEDDSPSRLFSTMIFKSYLTPKILEIFAVRDAQIRLLLLNYFPHYMGTFTKDQLQSEILPELLLGIKDTNDQLVSATLKTLADLVPLLGSDAVIGGKRAKLFNDGRPTSHRARKSISVLKQNKQEVTATADSSPVSTRDRHSLSEILNYNNSLPERQRPDGEENDVSAEEIEPSQGEDLDNWEDWDTTEQNLSVSRTESSENLVQSPSGVNENAENLLATASLENNRSSSNNNRSTKRIIPDISELDIKNQVNNNDLNSDVDFFQDMEPVIETSSKFLIDKIDRFDMGDKNFTVSKFLNVIDDNNEDGWEKDWE